MRRHPVVRFALIGILGIAAPALVVAPAEAQKKSGKDKKGKMTVIDFNEDNVSTTYLKPESTVIEQLNTGKRSSLIRIRRDFLAEIVRSAEDL